MTLRGGGRKGGGGSTTQTRKWSSSNTGGGKGGGLTQDQKEIFEAITKRMKSDKKSREKQKTTRTLANLLKKAGVIEGEAEDSSDSDASSNDGLDALFGTSKRKNKRTSSKGSATTTRALESAEAQKLLQD